MGSRAGPVVARDVEVYPLAARSRADPMVLRNIDVLPTIGERGFESHVLGNHSLATSHVKDVLFNLGVAESVPHSPGITNTVLLELECVDCRTWGSALVTTNGVDKHEDFIHDIISFFKDPVDTVVNAFDIEVKIEFLDVGGHFEFDLVASDTVTYTYSIFTSETPAGIAISSDVSIGLVLFVDLVFSLTAEIDLEAGFEFAFPEGAYITVDPLEGKIIDHGFTGGETNSLPIICTSGSATFKAALRVRVQAGTTVAIFGTGFDFSLGVYADLIEYVATLDTTPTCELEITECLDVNVGAYAHAVVELDYMSMGVAPAVVTTLLKLPLPSLCVTRPHGSSLPALPTSAPLSVISTIVSPLPANTASPTYTTSSSTPGGIFLEGSTTATVAAAISTSANSTLATNTGSSNATSAPAPTTSLAIKTGFSNATSTITSPASLITSTVWTTNYITVTSCSSTVLHCPASAASEVILTSTSILYTTVCPYGAILPTTLPSHLAANTSQSVSAQVVLHTALVSPLPLIPVSEELVHTVYVPTFVNPTYTMPTATSFPVAYPNWTADLNLGTATVVGHVVATPSTTPSVPGGSSNGTAVGTAKITPTSKPFTGAGGKENARLALVGFVAVGLLILL